MSRVSGGDTKPEIVVRKLLHAMGFRYRLHVRRLAGTPDIVLPRHRKVIFVHGCFWHGHEGCARSKRPATNKKFWNTKIDANIDRDRRAREELANAGWGVLVVWECETRERNNLVEKLCGFMATKESQQKRGSRGTSITAG